MTHMVGTSYYIAPEVLNGNYGDKSDIWGLGVIIYMMVTGSVPFGGSSDSKIIDKVKSESRNPNMSARLARKLRASARCIVFIERVGFDIRFAQ